MASRAGSGEGIHRSRVKRMKTQKLRPDLGYIGEDGKLLDDGLHDEMLNNPEAARAGRKWAFDAAIKRRRERGDSETALR